MSKKLATALAFLCLLMITNSCTKKGSTGPTGPAGPTGPSGPILNGAINGHVSLYDQYGTRTFVGLDKVQLTLKNGISAQSDINGYYLFGGLGSGTYTIDASAPGYAATMVNNLTFVKDTFYKDIKLSQKPTFQIAAFSAYHNAGSPNDSLLLTFDANTKPRSCIVFVGKSANVSNQPGTYLLSYIKTISPWAARNLVLVPGTDLNAVNIWYGERVYFAAYSYANNDVSVYEDPATGRNVYNAVGTAMVDSAMCP